MLHINEYEYEYKYIGDSLISHAHFFCDLYEQSRKLTQ